jgi:hypothetical protein
VTLTFRELLESLQTFSDYDLDKDATVDKDGDFFGVSHVGVSTSLDDALDEGHPFLSIVTVDD